MGMNKLVYAKQKLQRTISPRNGTFPATKVPKGHFAVYVGEMHKRFVVPVSYLSHPLFQELLHWAEEEFRFDNSVGGLTIPCTEDYFMRLVSVLRST